MVNTDRWYCRTEPARINREAIPAGGVRLYESSNHHDNFLECVRTRSKPAGDVDTISREHHPVPPGEHRLLAEAAAEVGPGRRAVRR